MFINQPSLHRYNNSNKLLLPHLSRIEEALGGKLVLVNMKEGEVSKLLDQKAGIDAYLVQSGQIKSIALRVETWKKRLYNSFTIRSHSYHSPNTELLKIPKAIQEGATYPSINIKIGLNKEGGWLAGAAIYTRHLYKFVEDNKGKVMSREIDCGDGTKFVWVSWSELKKACYNVRIF